MKKSYRYIIIGGQLAGASAAEGIREVDQEGPILLVGRENHLPYHRPPLSKSLWSGKKKLEGIFLHDQQYYEKNHVDLLSGSEVTSIDVNAKTITIEGQGAFSYEKLLLATGGRPKYLDIPGADLAGVYHYRYLDDYLNTREIAGEDKSALVIGGGFIGSEMAAALSLNKLNVTMIYPSSYLCPRVFPQSLGTALQQNYRARGIRIFSGEAAVVIKRKGARLLIRTTRDREILTDFVIVGVGIAPETRLAEQTDLQTEDGIIVDAYLRTSYPDIYAAGDNASFYHPDLGFRARYEHWDNAISQGKQAGRNMVGAEEPFAYLPYFFSDLFEFGYEAVGEVNSKLSVFSDWRQENETGVLYYLSDDMVKGVMLCNVWNKVSIARELIGQKRKVTLEELRGRIS